MRYVLAAVGLSLFASSLLAAGDDPPSNPLFDGKTLAGWVAEHTDRFRVRDGLLVQEGGGGWLRSENSWQDFELKAEFRIVREGTEGGLIFRAAGESDPHAPFGPAKGYQIQLGGGDTSLMLLGHGTMPPRFDRKTEELKKARKAPGEWQSLEVVAKGPSLEVNLNGMVVTTSGSLELKPGHIGLLAKSGSIEWRSLKLREIPGH